MGFVSTALKAGAFSSVYKPRQGFLSSGATVAVSVLQAQRLACRRCSGRVGFMDAWMNNRGRARCEAEQESRWSVSSMITSCAVWL